jgi:hypothetical protein
MGNRRHHKKLRVDVRARMARTGETYQQALERIRKQAVGAPHAELVSIEWFGGRAALATIQHLGMTSFFVLSTPHGRMPFAVRAARTIH